MADSAYTPTSSRFIDLTSRRFGRWTVLSLAKKKHGTSYWICRCDCGTEKTVSGGNLRNGKTTSCGCFRKEFVSQRKFIHGRSMHFGRDATYNIWIDMRRRCGNPQSRHFVLYGGRGISVCPRWVDGEGSLSGFECFLADMGERPSDKHSIDREDVNGNYEPGNCRWATTAEQARNKRNTRWVQFGGESMCITDAIQRSGIPVWTVYDRLRRGWDIDRALTQPVLQRKWNRAARFAAD